MNTKDPYPEIAKFTRKIVEECMCLYCGYTYMEGGCPEPEECEKAYEFDKLYEKIAKKIAIRDSIPEELAWESEELEHLRELEDTLDLEHLKEIEKNY